MVKQAYITRTFYQKSLDLIEQANTILEEFQERGHTLSLRQLYYQFVARDLLPNKKQSYDRLGDVMSNARLAGLVDWDLIVDRGRILHELAHDASPADALRSVADYYHRDYWADQDWRPEVWVEKEALVEVIGQVCEPLDVPYIAVKGYTSQSTMRERARHLARYAQARGQRPIVFYLGDHDPSGVDMSRDIQDRVNRFAEAELPLRRLALNWDQIQTYRPPPNHIKEGDVRSAAYQAQYGNECWELDALSPEVISGLVEIAINSVRDPVQWAATERREATERARLQEVARRLPSN